MAVFNGDGRLDRLCATMVMMMEAGGWRVFSVAFPGFVFLGDFICSCLKFLALTIGIWGLFFVVFLGKSKFSGGGACESEVSGFRIVLVWPENDLVIVIVAVVNVLILQTRVLLKGLSF